MSDTNKTDVFAIMMSILIAAALIGAALWYVKDIAGDDNAESVSVAVATVPEAGDIGSAHEHMSMLIVINNTPINMNQPRYMLKDLRVHFEDNDGVSIHKHATGITLPYFLTTLNIDITPSCISFDTGQQYCNTSLGEKKLRVFINGRQIQDLDTYELAQWDKILIDYGDSNENELIFKFNNVPELPAELQ